jgi:hypothetical protein
LAHDRFICWAFAHTVDSSVANKRIVFFIILVN